MKWLVIRELIVINVTDWIAENRSNEGTPFIHQARLKGVGVDCIGSIVVSAGKFGQDISNVPSNYGRSPDPSIILDYLSISALVRPDESKKLIPGYIAVVIIQTLPQHFGVLSENGNWIHACSSTGKVVEVPFTYKDKRIHSIWIPTFVDFSL